LVIATSACFIIPSVSFGIGALFLFSPDEAMFKIKLPFETLSPTLTITESIIPCTV
jgi:hypothetical protein